MHASCPGIDVHKVPCALLSETDTCNDLTSASTDFEVRNCAPRPSMEEVNHATVNMEHEREVPIEQLKKLSINYTFAEDVKVEQEEEKYSEKIEKKEEFSLKEEDKSEATIVTVYLPLPEEPLIPPRPLGIGEIPSNYVTAEDRAELLDSCVKRHSIGGEGVRRDLLHCYSRTFVSGVIEGLFETHLLKATYEEVRAINKRTARRRRRHHKFALRANNKHGIGQSMGNAKGEANGKAKRKGKNKGRRSWNSESTI